MPKPHTPLILIILDGWGYNEELEHNAIAAANTPTWDHLWQHYPHTLINGSGTAVGLPDKQMGNSEVGHLNIGAGRVVRQDYSRINHTIDNHEFFSNPVLINAVDAAINTDHAIHVFGLLSPGGVHSHQCQIQAMLELAVKRGATKVYLHAFLDGRDTPPKSALTSISAMEQVFAQLKHGQIASLCGRYYAMDRDKRWQRTQAAYDLLTLGKTEYHADTAADGLAQAYERGETDEFVQPTAIHERQQPPITIHDGDVIVFMNFRADRARQLTHAFIDENFSGFKRQHKPKLNDFVTLTKYAKDFNVNVAFPPEHHDNVLGDYLAQHNLKQLRIAETEKYAHVTYFFNGGSEIPFAGEDRELIPSPKVATYDLQPEMNAPLLTQRLIAAIESQQYDFIVCNFANPDMVGHTGNFAATVKAIETIDDCLAKITAATTKVGGEICITADHGNAEQMHDINTGQAHTAHTNEPVPLIYIGRSASFKYDDGTLADLAPTLLSLLDLEKPKEMTGKNLLTLTD